MKANELRIGNWLYDPHSEEPVIQVTGIAHDIGGFEGYILQFGKGHKGIIDDEGELQYLPIPLTPKVLEECGFTVTMQNQIHRRTDFTNTLFGTISNLNGEYQFLANGRLIVLKYLHQLQNLYFALTSEELNFTP